MGVVDSRGATVCCDVEANPYEGGLVVSTDVPVGARLRMVLHDRRWSRNELRKSLQAYAAASGRSRPVAETAAAAVSGQVRSATWKLRIARVGFGTGRQRGTTPTRSRRTCSPQHALHSCYRDRAGRRETAA